MTCRPEKVSAYVDGELEPAARAEIEAHLAQCPVCAEQARFERELRGRLRSLPAPELPSHLEHDVRRKLRGARGRSLRVWLPMAAALTLAVLWGRGSASVVAWQLARDHQHCFGKAHLPAQVWATDVAAVAPWFEARGTALPPLPDAAGGIELVGARFCPLLDRKVAHLYYADGARRVSLYVVPGPARLSEGFSGQALGRPVRMRRVAGHTVGIVADRAADADAFERAFQITLAYAEIDGERAFAPGSRESAD